MNYLQRKRYALMKNRTFRGYLRTYSGNPVTLTECMNDYPVITVSGNSVQDGTPTSAAPLEIQNCGDKTVNLLDISQFYSTTINGVTFTVEKNGVRIQGSTTVYPATSKVITLDNGSYTIWHNGNPKSLFRVRVYTSEGYKDYGAGYSYGNTFEVNEEVTKVEARFQVDKLTDVDKFVQAAIYPSDKALNYYEPYGYKIPVKQSGKNLFDKDNAAYAENVTYTSTSNGNFFGTHYVSETGHVVRMYYISIKPNTTYTFSKAVGSFNRVVTSQTTPIVGEAITNKNSDTSSNVATITSGENDKYLCFYPLLGSETVDIAYDDVLATIQIEEGITATDYEPYEEKSFNVYSESPINGIENVSDKIVLDVSSKTATFIKNIDSFTYSSNYIQDISQYTGAKETVTNYRMNLSGILNAKKVKTVHFPNDSSIWGGNVEGVCCMKDGTIDIAISYETLGITSEATTAERESAIKTWLTNQASNGTPFSGIYQSSTSTKEDISALQDWDNIPKLNKGTNVISITSAIQPSDVQVEYYASKIS